MYITTTLPYINADPHIGHTFEFVLADVTAAYLRFKYGKDAVFFNVGVDEHGQKIAQKAHEMGYSNVQDYCDTYAARWLEFCTKFKIDYDHFYRTTSQTHKENVLRFLSEISEFIYEKEYEGKYCVGCESFITEKEIVNNRCPIHKTELQQSKEVNKFFKLKHFKGLIDDKLVDKSKSEELRNIFDGDYDLSITRKNVEWGIKTADGDTLYVWFEALLNYIFAIKYYDDEDFFNKHWGSSTIICGKDNLKFQAFILPAILAAHGIQEPANVLVHGIILDEKGDKMSKTQGNVIDPIDQLNKYGLDAVRLYLFAGLNIFNDSKYSEDNLKYLWNDTIVNGLGNLISRLLHLIQIKNVTLDENNLSAFSKAAIELNEIALQESFENYQYDKFFNRLKGWVSVLNNRITTDKPFSAECVNAEGLLNDYYHELKALIPYYTIILKDNKEKLEEAFRVNKKVILFNKL